MSKRTPSLNYEEMVAMETDHRQRSSMYPTDKAQTLAFAENKISEIICKTAIELGEIADKQVVALNDTETVKDLTGVYLKACAEAAVIPTMQGWARSLGLTTRALSKYQSEHPSHPTSLWIELVHDGLAEALCQANMKGLVSAIPAIFVSKALFGLRDNQPDTSETMNRAEFNRPQTSEEIARKYQDLLD